MAAGNENDRNGEVTARHQVLTFIALLVLATVSLVAGTHIAAGPIGLATGVGIASIKAGLVFWFFMHLREQPFRSRLVILVALGLVALLIALTVLDVGTRAFIPSAPVPASRDAFYRR